MDGIFRAPSPSLGFAFFVCLLHIPFLGADKLREEEGAVHGNGPRFAFSQLRNPIHAVPRRPLIDPAWVTCPF